MKRREEERSKKKAEKKTASAGFEGALTRTWQRGLWINYSSPPPNKQTPNVYHDHHQCLWNGKSTTPTSPSLSLHVPVPGRRQSKITLNRWSYSNSSYSACDKKPAASGMLGKSFPMSPPRYLSTSPRQT